SSGRKGCSFPRRPHEPASALLRALRHPHAGRLDDPVRLAPLDHVCGGTRSDPLHRDLSGGNVLPRRGRLPRLVPGAAGGVLPVAAPQVRGASLRDPATGVVVTRSPEALDRIARSREAVFAIDSGDRIIWGNKKCEGLLGKPARAVLGKRCYDVMGGRDENGNIYCYRSCPVAYQARERPAEPVQRFPLSVEAGKGGRKWFEVSLFAI